MALINYHIYYTTENERIRLKFKQNTQITVNLSCAHFSLKKARTIDDESCFLSSDNRILQHVSHHTNIATQSSY